MDIIKRGDFRLNMASGLQDKVWGPLFWREALEIGQLQTHLKEEITLDHHGPRNYVNGINSAREIFKKTTMWPLQNWNLYLKQFMFATNEYR